MTIVASIHGRLGSDPEQKTTASGKDMTRASIAADSAKDDTPDTSPTRQTYQPNLLNRKADTPDTSDTPEKVVGEEFEALTPQRLWSIVDADGNRWSSSFTPPATLAEVQRQYPGAVCIEPEPPAPRRC